MSSIVALPGARRIDLKSLTSTTPNGVKAQRKSQKRSIEPRHFLPAEPYPDVA
jgi:hypothetical protein